jgi:hypothetical protein
MKYNWLERQYTTHLHTTNMNKTGQLNWVEVTLAKFFSLVLQFQNSRLDETHVIHYEMVYKHLCYVTIARFLSNNKWLV